jgi:acetylornithine deacetylase/succinyl-diaminopimelate desuccinylase-like protein
MVATRIAGALILVSALVSAPRPSSAQRTDFVASLSARPDVRQALDAARRGEPDTIRDQIRLCEIPAPPFGEAARAAAYAEAMRGAGLSNVRLDAEGNVVGERRGRTDGPRLVLSAHLDTVFPADVPVRVTRNGNRLHGPGIGDDCRGLAVVLAVARALNEAAVQTGGPITFVGTVGEEGLGDLRGVKALLGSTLKDRIDRFVSVDGDAYTVTHVGVGSRRYRVTFSGPGGHSYDDFGRASPTSALGLAVAAISRLRVPATPRTTFGVGRVGGGTSINAIATEAWMEVDLRSVDPLALASLDRRVQGAIQEALEEENGRRRSGDPLTVSVQLVGNRPAGRTELNSPVVDAALAALRTLRLPLRLDEGSTDANLPMSVGVPSITVGGGGLGLDAHSPRESFDTTDSWKGTLWVLLLAVALAE